MLLKLDSIHDKNNGEQFYAKACREYTLPRNDGSSQPKGWIQGDTKVGPVLEVTTSCLYGKHGVGIHCIAARPISPKVHEQWANPNNFTGRILLMSVFNDIIW